MSWQLPVKTDHMLKEANFEPSQKYAQNIHKVASMLKDSTALEIGAAWGLSTLAILEAGAKHLTSVDNNLNIKAPKEVEMNGYKNWTWQCMKSEQYWKENEGTYDLIYIDGSHLYEDVKNDLYEAWKVLNDGGFLMVDDWDHKNNQKVDIDGKSVVYGVSLACWEFWRDHPCPASIEGRVLWFEK